MSGIINDPKAKHLAMIFATYSTLADKGYCILDFSRYISQFFITDQEISIYLMKIYRSGWNPSGWFFKNINPVIPI